MATATPDLRQLAFGPQNNRLLRLLFPNDDAPYKVLLANGFNGTEYVSRDFHFSIEILADDAGLQPRDFIGKMLCVQLLRNDGSLRHFNGYVFAFRLIKTDGGTAFYEAQIGPWLRYLKFRQNNRLFHNENLAAQTATVLQDYGVVPAWDWQVCNDDDMPMTMACQFGEDDHNYLHRRWEFAGFMYRYEHTENAHKLVVSGSAISLPQIDGGSPEIRFQSKAGSQEADGMADWSPGQQVIPNQVVLSKFDFKNPAPYPVDTRFGKQNPNVPLLEHYEYTGAYGFKNFSEGEDLLKRRLDEFETAEERFEGRGNNRFAMPGRWFRLTDHFGFALDRRQEDDEYLIVSVRHEVTNNYLQGANKPAEYRNTLTCVRRATRWRPGRGFNSVNTKILAPQTATVVGIDGSGSIHTDEYGRCLVRFHWDRDSNYTTWIRVASAWAGADQGLAALPRIGSEVIVQWLDGSPDRPIITGRVANAYNMPSWKLPEQSALMGIRSRELKGENGNSAVGRGNHVILDDTANQIQAQIRSDHANSQLSLGFVTRIENVQGRQDARGQGFELRTDQVGALRSGKGMLISTEVRPRAQGHLSDVSEPGGRLAQAQALHGQLGKLAHQHDAQDSGSDQGKVADALKTQNDGITGAGSSGGSDDSFPELNEAHLLFAGAAGIAATTPASMHLTGGQYVAITSGEDVSIVTGKSLFAGVSEKFSLFVHRMGMKLIAASGKVQIQAQNDDIELLAKKVISIISTSDWINITAKQGIKLNAGNSQLVISAQGINGFTPGGNVIHAANHGTQGPQSVPAKFPGSDLCASLTGNAAQVGSASVALS